MPENGIETSEYRVARSVTLWSTIIAVAGLALASGQSIVGMFGGPTSDGGIIATAVLGVVGILVDMVVAMGYTKSRTTLKLDSSGGGS